MKKAFQAWDAFFYVRCHQNISLVRILLIFIAFRFFQKIGKTIIAIWVSHTKI